MRPRYPRISGILIRDRDVTVPLSRSSASRHGGSESGEEEKGDGSNSASTAQGDESGLVLAGGAGGENPKTGTSNCETKGRTGEAKVESVGYLNPRGSAKARLSSDPEGTIRGGRRARHRGDDQQVEVQKDEVGEGHTWRRGSIEATTSGGAVSLRDKAGVARKTPRSRHGWAAGGFRASRRTPGWGSPTTRMSGLTAGERDSRTDGLKGGWQGGGKGEERREGRA